jgi:hypothetical protein
VTTYKAVKVAGTRSSDLVAVFGVVEAGVCRGGACGRDGWVDRFGHADAPWLR